MKLLHIAAALVSLTLAAPAHAALYNIDFASMAFGNEGSIEGQYIDLGGLGVTATSSHYAYLDDKSGGRPAGLGVCKALNGAGDCSPSNDDNITSGEWLTLTFSKAVSVVPGTTFRDADHFDISNSLGTALVSLVGADNSTYGPTSLTFGFLNTATSVLMKSITFAYGGTSPNQFYLSTLSVAAVPLPAALPLLGVALAGLGLVARRRKQQVAA